MPPMSAIVLDVGLGTLRVRRSAPVAAMLGSDVVHGLLAPGASRHIRSGCRSHLCDGHICICLVLPL